ncbi:hypothetical protein MKZ38_006919 [Zalerion maritima]|uniref:Fe2OG dioxygenase domain-containing protein n=1 Tax=Zalerion maritima TaxID=339359 RepID=A0AAD5WTU3_9PEZI|nr:hypothetical protein MKZ38_006919 [Zalerion maritima]
MSTITSETIRTPGITTMTPKRAREADPDLGIASRTRSRFSAVMSSSTPVPAMMPVISDEPDMDHDDDYELVDEDDESIIVIDADEAVPQTPLVNSAKPVTVGYPPVWAYKRQSLCSALPYFDAYQSGMYHKYGKPHGILIDQAASKRDLMLEQVVITTVGGGRDLDEAGNRVRLVDQRESNSLQCIRAALDHHYPLVIIAGIENPTTRVKVPFPYSILGIFHVTDLWQETVLAPTGQIAQWVFRLEKVDLNRPSWWAPANDPTANTYVPGQYVASIKQCATCGEASKQIFSAGWACLNKKACRDYFNFGFLVDVDALTYSNDFLCERTAFTHTADTQLPALVPELPLSPNGVDTFGTEKEYFNGIVCRLCGCCSRRKSWARWVCENPGCAFKCEGKILPIPTEIIHRENADFRASRRRSLVDPVVKIKMHGRDVGGFSTDIYYLPNDAGKIIGSLTIMRANEVICARPGGPDDMFTALQGEDLHLERNPALRAGGKREILTKHFAKNWGAKYKFGVTVASTGFEEAPDTILRATQRLRWAGERAIEKTVESFDENEDPGRDVLPSEFIQFNEMLSIGYFRDGKISYHDDGEKELGPTVATLSLGSPSVMSIRPKNRSGIQPRGNVSSRREKPAVIRFNLYHGDMVVMHGTQIHRFYEHQVIPQGKRRYALTCRYIRPELMQDEADRVAAVQKGRMPRRAEIFAYHGDMSTSGITTSVPSAMSIASAPVMSSGNIMQPIPAPTSPPTQATNTAQGNAQDFINLTAWFNDNPAAANYFAQNMPRNFIPILIALLYRLSNPLQNFIGGNQD